MKCLVRVMFACSSMLLAVLATAAPVKTAFDPAKHGFRFRNDFQNEVPLPLGTNVRTGGLCGGMAYASLDYFLAKHPVPTQNFRPANGTPLQKYLLTREVQSLLSNADKWSEVTVNPGGARDSEFFNWGLQGTNGGRLQELRSFLDRGIPVPLGLKSHNGGDHQVLAIGYDMGRYRGDLGPNEGDLKIFLYDSNHPGRSMTLVPDLANKVYHYPAGDNDNDASTWRTYFVDKNYHQSVPPVVPELAFTDGTVHALVLAFATGADDLRGGNDNIDLTVDLLDGTQQRFSAINLRAKWLSNYTEFAEVMLQRPVQQSQIKDLLISDTFSGGAGGDNWDMAKLDVGVNGKDNIIKSVGFRRFTGDKKQLLVPINNAPPPVAGQVSRLVLEVRTGSDDLRGGNDNLNVEVRFADGHNQVENNVNHAAKWDNNTTHTVTIMLNRPVMPADIRSLTLQTTFTGGTGGDNWNMDSIKVTAVGNGINKVIATFGANRFTGNRSTLTVSAHP